MTIEYKGKEFVYAVVIPTGYDGSTADATARMFNQTEGSSTIEADDIELDTKDKTGSDYGKVTETVNIEGILTENDPAIKFLKDKIRARELVTIYEINTRTKEAEKGLYKINSFERSSANGEFVTYSLEATLNGSITPETLTTIPAGAPDSEA